MNLKIQSQIHKTKYFFSKSPKETDNLSSGLQNIKNYFFDPGNPKLKKELRRNSKRGFVTPHCTELGQLTTLQRTNQKALLSVQGSFVLVHKSAINLCFQSKFCSLGVLAQIAL